MSDGTNVEWLQAFHLYKGFNRKQASVGLFIKGAAKVIEPPKLESKGHKFRFNKKGDVCRGLIIRQKYNIIRKDGSSVIFNNNNIILIKKKQNIKSKFLIGPTTVALKRKKFKSLFEKIV